MKGELALVAACYSLDVGSRIASCEWFVEESKKIMVNPKFLGYVRIGGNYCNTGI
jgi:hypothetical protein